MKSTAKDVIYLVSCALRSETPEKTLVEKMDLDAVYAFAGRHMIKVAVAFALESAGCKDQRSAEAVFAAIRKTAIFDRAWTAIKKELEDAGIWYMPLKGAILKGMYPKYGMREFADHDILFDADRAEDVRAIMEGLGFETAHFGGGYHDCYHKLPCLNFEMHRALFGPGHEEKLNVYYQDVERRLLRGEGCERKFTPEDFYLFFLAHEHKHYSDGGTGLRSLMDTYVYLRATEMDMDYVAGEAEKMGLREFETQNRQLALRLFSGKYDGEGNAASGHAMLDYILSSGTYGTFTHHIQNQLRKNGWSKLWYILNRLAVPVSRKNKDYVAYAKMYPLFYKYKVLLPILPFYRTFRSIKDGRFKNEAKALRKV